MANKQSLTNANKKRLLDELDQEYQDAILMHYGGWRYERIAKELKKSYGTVRQWFMTGGICQPAYDELLKKHARENRKKAKRIDNAIDEALPDALETLRLAAKAGNWMAAQSIMHMGGHSPVTKIKAEVENTVKEKTVENLKKIEEYAKQTITDDSEGNS